MGAGTGQANHLVARGISVRFGGVNALRDVSINVDPGEIVGLIGPNGAGKTTLVNVLSGAVRPNSGSVTFDGLVISGLRQFRIVRLGLSRTFQVPKPFRGMTLRDNLFTAAYFGRQDDASESDVQHRIADIAELLGLAGKLGFMPDQLTVADLKKLEIGRALCSRAKAILLDEAMCGLNPKEMAEVIDLCRRVNARGVSLLVIEHVMAAISQLADRVVVLNLGEKLCEGTPTEVFRDPAVVKAYLGSRFAERQRRTRERIQ